MKKIYTLFAAAAVAMSATAAAPALEPHQITAPSMQLHQNLSTLSLQSPAQINRPAKAPKANAAAAATSVADFENLYLHEFYSGYDGWLTGGLSMIGDLGDGTVGVDGFWMEDMPLVGGVFDPATQTIAFPAQDTGLTTTISGTTYNIVISMLDATTFTMLSDDMVFNVSLEDREIWFEGTVKEVEGKTAWGNILAICALTSDGQFAGVLDALCVVDFNVVNSYCSYSYLAESTDTELTEGVDYIYTEIQGNNLVVSNLLSGGFAYDVPFAVDATALTATVTDGVVSQQQDSDGTFYDFCLYGMTVEGQNASITGTTVDFDVQVVEQEGEKLTGIGTQYCACGTSYQGEFLPWLGDGIIYGLTVVYQGDLIADMAGVEDITIDEDNSNAPVEYFNLQGQRVANPANGQILIRRQGSQASKVRF